MTKSAFDKFRRSMSIGYMEWHEGIGYDLDALSALDARELSAAEDLLLARHAADWRDIEALDHIGSSKALEELRRALGSKALDIRIEAARRLALRKLLSQGEIEAIVVTALATATILDGMVKTLDFAAAHPSPRVRSELLRCAVDGNEDIRAHAAALVHFLHGGSASAFDWKFRPLYLRFNSRDRTERLAAYRELCSLMGVAPEAG